MAWSEDSDNCISVYTTLDHQLNPSGAKIAAHIDQFEYFMCNLASNNGFFVSFTRGRLPLYVSPPVPMASALIITQATGNNHSTN